MRIATLRAAGEFTAWLAAQQHSGAMVALYPTPADARRLLGIVAELPAGSTPSAANELHLTLAYLGETAAQPASSATAANRAAAFLARGWPPMRGEISGIARFRNGEGEQDALVALFDAPLLAELRHDLVLQLLAAPLAVDAGHGFTPHITLAYLPKDAPTPDIALEPFEMTLGILTVAWGDKQERHKLTGAPRTGQSLGDGRS